MPRVSLKQVAQATGVNVSTVSRALRNHGRIPPATRQRIQQAAQQLGYRPDPVLASLASGQFRRSSAREATPIAFVWSTITAPRGDDLNPAQERVAELGYRVQEFRLQDFPSPVRLGEVLFARGFRGIILGRLYGYDRLPEIDWSHFAVVSKGRNFFPAPFSTVRANHFEGIQRLWQTATARGYRRIGFAMIRHAPVVHPDDRERWGAIWECLQNLPANRQVPPLTAGPQPDNPAFVAWYKRYRPDAVISFWPHFYYRLQEAGVRIPEDCGFASLLRDPASTGDAPITGLMLDRLCEAVPAVEMLDSQIRRGNLGPQKHPADLVFPLPWMEGSSLPPRLS